MLINGKEVGIDELLSNTNFEDNIQKSVNEGLTLTNYQIAVLSRYNIDYASTTSIKSLSYLIEDALADCDDEELELIADEIAERNYYENTNK